MGDQTAYPLSWPVGWPRTKNPSRSRFGTYTKKPSVAHARHVLDAELSRLGARNLVLSTNMELRLDGQPRSDRRYPTDSGAAVYFTLNGKPSVLACDKWNTVGDNIYAIAKHVEALRGQERWGVGTREQAFSGYVALNEKTEPTCWETLGISMIFFKPLPKDQQQKIIASTFREKVKTAHPDGGGTVEAFERLNRARDTALQSI